jgi:hypothetical protein
MDTIYYSLKEVELLYKEFMAHRTKNVMVRLLISVQLVFESFLLTCMSFFRSESRFGGYFNFLPLILNLKSRRRITRCD